MPPNNWGIGEDRPGNEQMHGTPNDRDLASTLGLFVRGIPAVFVRIDIFARQPPELNEYVRFYTRTRRDFAANAEFSNPSLTKGYEYFITTSHEVRHFHDAVLSRPLFELFLLRCKRSLALMQLADSVETMVAWKRFPSLADLKDRAPSESRELLAYLERVNHAFVARFGELMKVQVVCGRRIYLSHLLEASAMVLELANLVHVHGWEQSEHYHKHVVRSLPDEYTAVLELVSEFTNTWEETLTITHLVVTACLYDDHDPVEAFSALMNGAENGNQLIDRSLLRRQTLFADEDKLRSRVEKIDVVAGNQPLPSNALAGTSLDGLRKLPRQMLDVRSSLIKKWSKEWVYDISQYVEKLDEVPLPPTVFFPTEDASFAIPYAAVGSPLSQAYILAASKTANGEYDNVVSAIVPTVHQPSCVSLDAVDLVMFMYYVWCRMFEGSDSVFAIEPDGIYEQLFAKYYLSGADEPH